MSKLRKIIAAIIIAILMFIGGVSGLVLIEDWSIFDSAYMVAITLSTVGFTEVGELSPGGRTFIMFLIFAGAGYYLYLAGVIIQAIVEGEIRSILGRKRLDKKIII